jgi:tRNA pseudouridine55 synthase
VSRPNHLLTNRLTEWEGVLNLLKPPGLTSHDVVACLRRWLRMRQVGHTGTLDPGACGVLVVCLGRATRLAEWLAAEDKSYRAEMTLGVRTSSQDATGTALRTEDASSLTEADLLRVLPHFTGPIEQIPPMVSAKKHQGQRLHELERAGQQVERPPQTVTIHALQLLDFTPGPQPRARLDVTCSKGTYVRTLCADLGEALGCGAMLSFLLRTRVGAYSLKEALTLEEVQAALEEGTLGDHLIPFDQALPHFPAVIVSPAEQGRVAQGQRLPSEMVAAPAGLRPGTLVCLRDTTGALLAVAVQEQQGGKVWYQPRKVFIARQSMDGPRG